MPRPSASTIVRRTAIALFAVCVGAQFIRPARTNPPIDPSRTIQARLSVTPEVSEILGRSCRDCHSNATVWPWYSNVAPVSWLLVSHVNNGRRNMSLSNWADYAPREARERLDEMCAEVREGDMPMSSYVLAHKSADLTDADRQTLCAWTERVRSTIVE